MLACVSCGLKASRRSTALPPFIEPAEKPEARGAHAPGRDVVGLLLQRAVRPFQAFLVAAGGEAGEGGREELVVGLGIERAQPVRALQMRQRDVAVAEIGARHAAVGQRIGRVRIDLQRPVDQRDAARHIAACQRDHDAGHPQHLGIVHRQFRGTAGHPRAFGDRVMARRHPALHLAVQAATATEGEVARALGVEAQRAVRQLLRLLDVLARHAVEMAGRAQEQVVGLDVLGRPARDALHLGEEQARFDHRGDPLGDAILQGEHVRDLALEPAGPELDAGIGFHQVAGDADAVAGAPHRAVEGVAHAKFAADLAHRHVAVPVGEG